MDTWNFPRVVGEALGVPRLHRQRIDTDTESPKVSLKKVDNNRSPRFDPAEYPQAKHRMKKALREFYRSVELLNDYRVSQSRRVFKKKTYSLFFSGIEPHGI